MVEKALQCLKEADSSAAITYLNQQAEPTAVAAAYHDLVRHLYWQEKNIPQVVDMSRAGIRYCLEQSEQLGGAGVEQYFLLRSTAKQLAYDLASFTWPGWNEAGIWLSPLAVEEGLDAARLNLHLALELNKGDLPLSRAYWMLGAHLMAKSALEGASANFKRAALYAIHAGSMAESWLEMAFAALVDWLADPQNDEIRGSYEIARELLANVEDGAALQTQLDHAQTAFTAQFSGRGSAFS